MQKLDLTTTSILLNWVNGKQPREAKQEELFIRELADQIPAQAFGIDKNLLAIN